ncbi:MAG: glycosyltransferase [Anaerolineae bacterium]
MVSISAAIPCYNGARWIGETVAALQRQTRLPDELLVIDDGSTDGSGTLAVQAGARVIAHAVNRGLSVARNTALAAASGDILVFVDSDAYADPGMIQALLAGFTAPDIAGVGGGGVEAHQVTRADAWRARHARQWHGRRAVPNAPYLHGLCAAYRRRALFTVGGFDTALRTNAEDVEMGTRLRRAGFRLVYTPDAVVYHQRADTLATLAKMIDRWYYWAARVRRARRDRPLRLFAGVVRSAAVQPAQDLCEMRPDLAGISLMMAGVKARAIVRGLNDAESA